MTPRPFQPAPQECYLKALDDCYLRFASKQEEASGRPFTAEAIDYFCFHHPYNKLVQKAFGRLFYMDARRGKLKKVRPVSCVCGCL